LRVIVRAIRVYGIATHRRLRKYNQTGRGGQHMGAYGGALKVISKPVTRAYSYVRNKIAISGRRIT
jgi:hypothetical protein